MKFDKVPDYAGFIQNLTDRIKELEDAILYHYNQKGDDRCWKDDVALYKLIGKEDHPGLSIPKEVMMDQCSKYIDCQQSGNPYSKPPVFEVIRLIAGDVFYLPEDPNEKDEYLVYFSKTNVDYPAVVKSSFHIFSDPAFNMMFDDKEFGYFHMRIHGQSYRLTFFNNTWVVG